MLAFITRFYLLLNFTNVCLLLQDTAAIIKPPVHPEQVSQFLWEHIHHDTRVLMSAVGKSVDDCALLMNLLLCNLMTPPRRTGLTSFIIVVH